MILEYIPLSHSERATCKYRREGTARISSRWGTVFGSFGDGRKPGEEQWWSPGSPARSEHTYSGWKAIPMSGGWNFQVHLVGNYRILFLEEKLLQERQFCTLQGVMDANNFNILWTEASWFGNKYLTPHYPKQGNHLYLIWTPSKTQLNSTEKERKQYFYLRPGKEKIKLPWRHMESLWSCHKLGWLAGPQWNLGDTE